MIVFGNYVYQLHHQKISLLGKDMNDLETQVKTMEPYQKRASNKSSLSKLVIDLSSLLYIDSLIAWMKAKA
jgi:anti-anti-sigma regulatory factor